MEVESNQPEEVMSQAVGQVSKATEGLRVTYIESLKSNLIRAYATRAPGFSRSIEIPVMPTTLDQVDTEQFLRAIGRLSGMSGIGLKIDREIRDLPSKDGDKLQSLIIVLTPETDMDIDKVFNVISEYEKV